MKAASVLCLALHALPLSRAAILKGWGASQAVLRDEQSTGDAGGERAWKASTPKIYRVDGDTFRETDQKSLSPGDDRSADRKLTGKFLHITDVHPDPYYKTHSNTEDVAACHRGKGPAGWFGAETSDCDSPVSLVNATFEWIRQNLRDEVDFVIWTGDSARHDNDEDIPRSQKQVVKQNQMLVDAFLTAFGKKDNFDDDDPLNDFVIPIVPTLGNNDILPHNIFSDGPNSWTTTYLQVWQQFIPEHQRHQFHRGGWFSVEVIPSKLIVFSLNTLYFFASNSAVDGCVNKHEPGYAQFEWLRIQLSIARARGMKAILMGHVPPARVDAKVSWEESCWQKYSLWMHSFRDIIVGGVYGHMNIDHFMLQDFKDVKKHVQKGIEYDDDDFDDDRTRAQDDTVSISSAQDYLISLRDTFSKIPKFTQKPSEQSEFKPDYSKIGGQYGERYSLTLVGPSVVPNYFPTIRVFSYNISGFEDQVFPMPGRAAYSLDTTELERQVREDETSPTEQDDFEDAKKKKKHRKPHKFPLPAPPPLTAPPGPGYFPQPLSLVSYTQYYANLTYINNDFVHKHEAEPTNDFTLGRWKPGKHHGKPPPSRPKPKPFKFEVEYDTATDKIYGLQDLTMNSVLNLARRIAGDKTKELSVDAEDIDANEKKHKKKKHRKHKNKSNKPRDKVWYAFVNRAFVQTADLEDLEDSF
jgi:endopolyphosphatase